MDTWVWFLFKTMKRREGWAEERKRVEKGCSHFCWRDCDKANARARTGRVGVGYSRWDGKELIGRKLSILVFFFFRFLVEEKKNAATGRRGKLIGRGSTSAVLSVLFKMSFWSIKRKNIYWRKILWNEGNVKLCFLCCSSHGQSFSLPRLNMLERCSLTLFRASVGGGNVWKRGGERQKGVKKISYGRAARSQIQATDSNIVIFIGL